MISLESPRLVHTVLIVIYWTMVVFAFAGLSVGLWVNLPWIAALSLLSLVILFYGHFIEPLLLTVKSFRVALVKEPKTWLKIAFLSDLHAGNGKPASFYARIVERTLKLEPDLVLIGGDLVEEASPSVQMLKSFERLRAPFGIYFILGNHDYLDDPHGVRDQLLKWGFDDVTNGVRKIEKDGRELTVIGLDDTWYGSPSLSVVRDAKEHPRLLLAHGPDMLLDLERGDADLVLAGHTHGGQVRLPFFGKLITLPQDAPQWLDRGLKVWKEMPVIISQGLGESDFRVRLFCPPQIVIVEVGI